MEGGLYHRSDLGRIVLDRIVLDRIVHGKGFPKWFSRFSPELCFMTAWAKCMSKTRALAVSIDYHASEQSWKSSYEGSRYLALCV